MIKQQLKNLLRNNRFILLLAIVVGLAFGEGAAYTKPVLVPSLGLVMTLSILEISARVFIDLKKIAIPVVVAIILNYIVLGGVYIVLSYFVDLSSIIDGYDELHTGFILVAAVPPAVAVIPFTFQLGGNMQFSLVGGVVSYLAALAITPLICILFLGTNFIDYWQLIIFLGELIVAPLIVSRIIRYTPLMRSIDSWRGPVVNWSFFILFYTIIGLNREVFLKEPVALLIVCGIAFISIFLLAEVIDRVSALFRIKKESRISLILLGTRKTYALAGAIAVVLFTERAAMPAAVCSAFNIFHFVWLTWRVKKMH